MATNVAATNIPPVPNEHSIISVPDSQVDKNNYTITLSRINNVWIKWFMDLRTKVNTINAASISLSNITTPGTVVSNGGGNFAAEALPAGTYGDATHVAQVTVSANGYITGITNVALATSGTVTSVGLAAPSQFIVTGSPVTTSGTLTLGWANEPVNTVFAGPASGGAGLPTFRTLTAADLPGSGATAGTYGDPRHIPQITINTAGQVTAVTPQNVSPFDSTGQITPGVLSINGSNPATFNVTAGNMLFDDYTNPTTPGQSLVPYGPFTGVTVPGIATRNATYIAIDNTGAIQQFADPLTNTQRRTYAFLGAVIHSNRTVINAVNCIASTVQSTTNQLQDLMSAIGPLNVSGNVFSANGANLMINQSAGTIFKFGSNMWTNQQDPHVVALSGGTALSFNYRLSNGTEYAATTTIDVNNYENPLGTLTAVPALLTTWHVQRINIFQSGAVRIQYGQQVYGSQAAAIAGISSDPYVTESNIAENGILRCYLVINRGILNLNTSATFIAVTKFGAPSVSASGSITSVGAGQGLNATPNNPITSTGIISVDIPTAWAYT